MQATLAECGAHVDGDRARGRHLALRADREVELDETGQVPEGRQVLVGDRGHGDLRGPGPGVGTAYEERDGGIDLRRADVPLIRQLRVGAERPAVDRQVDADEQHLVHAVVKDRVHEVEGFAAQVATEGHAGRRSGDAVVAGDHAEDRRRYRLEEQQGVGHLPGRQQPAPEIGGGRVAQEGRQHETRSRAVFAEGRASRDIGQAAVDDGFDQRAEGRLHEAGHSACLDGFDRGCADRDTGRHDESLGDQEPFAPCIGHARSNSSAVLTPPKAELVVIARRRLAGRAPSVT
ncbi:hypothetical protein [Streptomyces sp. TBY4]|uniref:hypothetical protein n=1 Tax=Streptomyces sp. TBY4 TaxID=2962030 RepID=UPI0027E52D63|nr:hypothetical protein [Streptomyces sp. TBY4]